MYIVKSLSTAAARRIKAANPEETSDIERMAAIIALEYVVKYGVPIVALILGLMTGELLNTAIALVCIGALRSFSGGWHFRNLDACFAVSAAVPVIIAQIELSRGVAFALTFGAFALVARFGGDLFQRYIDEPIPDLKRRKIIALSIVAINFVILNSVAALAFAAQALTLFHFEEVTRHEKGDSETNFRKT